MTRTCSSDKPELCHSWGGKECNLPIEKRCACSKITIEEVPMSDQELADENKRYWKIITTIALILTLASFLLATGAVWYKWSIS